MPTGPPLPAAHPTRSRTSCPRVPYLLHIRRGPERAHGSPTCCTSDAVPNVVPMGPLPTAHPTRSRTCPRVPYLLHIRRGPERAHGSPTYCTSDAVPNVPTGPPLPAAHPTRSRTCPRRNTRSAPSSSRTLPRPSASPGCRTSNHLLHRLAAFWHRLAARAAAAKLLAAADAQRNTRDTQGRCRETEQTEEHGRRHGLVESTREGLVRRSLC